MRRLPRPVTIGPVTNPSRKTIPSVAVTTLMTARCSGLGAAGFGYILSTSAARRSLPALPTALSSGEPKRRGGRPGKVAQHETWPLGRRGNDGFTKGLAEPLQRDGID